MSNTYEILKWSLLVQKIMQLTGDKVLIHSASTRDEGHQYLDIKSVPLMLGDWQCGSPELVVCVKLLMKFVVDNHAMDTSIGLMLQDWITALTRVGYVFPPVGNNTDDHCFSSDVIFKPVDYSGGYQGLTVSGKAQIPTNNLQQLQKTYTETCSSIKMENISNINFTQPWIQFDDILLLVVFNKVHYESIPYIDTLYRPFFPYILYCGPGMPNFALPQLQRLRGFDFTFYSHKLNPPGHLVGAFNYECVSRAMRMQYPVDGYFFISDDVIFNLNKTTLLPNNHTWYVPQNLFVTFNPTANPVAWGHSRYLPETTRLLTNMKQQANSDSVVGTCYRKLVARNGGDFVNGGLADIYYIPKRLARTFASMVDFFHQHNVWIEIAIATIITCIEEEERTERIPGINRGWAKYIPWEFFTRHTFQDLFFMHPTKWSSLSVQTGDPRNRHLCCNKVLPWMHDRFGVVPL